MNEVIVRTDFSDELWSPPHNYICRLNPSEILIVEKFLKIIDLDAYIKIENLDNTDIKVVG